MNRRAAEHQGQSLLKELEEEIRELKQRSATLTQLVLSEDYLHFLKVQTEVVLPLHQSHPFEACLQEAAGFTVVSLSKQSVRL